MSDTQAGASTLSSKGGRLVFGWKILEYTGLVLFLAVVPRGMGPTVYGEFAVLFSLLLLIWMASSLGAQAAYGRFIPEFHAQGRMEDTHVMFSQFFLLRGLLVVLLTPVFLVSLHQLLPGLDAAVLWSAGGVFLVGAISMSSYQLQFGLNHLGRWLSRESSAKLLLVLFLLLFGSVIELGNTVRVMLAIEIFFLMLGIYWARKYFVLDRRLLDLSGVILHIRFGLLYFISSLLLLVVWRSGEFIIVKQAVDGINAVAFYSIANAITMALDGLFAQLAVLIVPSLSVMHVSGAAERKLVWLATNLKYTSLLTWMTMIVFHVIGAPILTLLVGAEFLPVTGILQILLFALIPMNIIRLGTAQAIVHKRLHYNLWVVSTALLVYLGMALALTPTFGARGASVAVVLGALAGSVVAYRMMGLGEVFRISRFWLLSVIGVGALLLSWAPYLPGLLTGILAMVCLLAGVYIAGIFRLEEIRWILGDHGKTV